MTPKVALDLMNESHFLPLLFEALSQVSLPSYALYGSADGWQSFIDTPEASGALPYHQPPYTSLDIKNLWQQQSFSLLLTNQVSLCPQALFGQESVINWAFIQRPNKGQELWLSYWQKPLELLSLEQLLTLSRQALKLLQFFSGTKSWGYALAGPSSGSEAETQFLQLCPQYELILNHQDSGQRCVVIQQPLLYQARLQETLWKAKPSCSWWRSKASSSAVILASGYCGSKMVVAQIRPQNQEEFTQALGWAQLAAAV